MTQQTPSAPRVLVTRPQREAVSWVQGLQAQGVDAQALPLIDIAPARDALTLTQVWGHLSDHDAVMFVSANAVRHFMAARPAGVPVPEVQAWGTGPGTEAALREAGWSAQLIRCPGDAAPQFDSEALWALVQDEVRAWPNQGTPHRVLIVRGGDAQGRMAGRDWLARQMAAAGLQVGQCTAYVRQAPVWDAAQRTRARQALAQGHWWLFSSSEAAVHLQQALPDADLRPARALATHPRIAERLQQMGWGRVVLVPATLLAQALSIKSLT